MMYFDTGGVIADVDAIKMALMKLSPKNIVFGTDYPMETRDGRTIKGFIEGIRGLPSRATEVEGILGENGRALVGV